MKLERLPLGDGHDNELLSQHVARYEFAAGFARDKRVLDVACGNGYGGEILLRNGADTVVGIDVSEEAVETARTNYGSSRARFLSGDAESLPEIGMFDLIISFETIEHLQHPDRFLNGIVNRLSPGGTFIVSTPLRLAGDLDDTPNNPFHVREWNEAEFTELVGTYLRVNGRYYQFVLRKRFYPGSRTISKFVSRLLRPADYMNFMKFPVQSISPPSLPGILQPGYIVLKCGR